MPVNRIALSQKIDRRTVYKIVEKFDRFGVEGLKDHKPGRLFEPLNPEFYDLVIDGWKRNKCGSRKLHKVLCKKGFSVSQRKIQQVMDFEKLTKPCPKRRGKRKYKRYEWPLSNLFWHTDWYECPFTKKNIIVFIDDHSRFVVGFGAFDNETTKNAFLVLYNAVAKYGVPYKIFSDRGSQFYANKRDKRGQAMHQFEIGVEEMGILLGRCRPRHPQSNGKIERFFRTYQDEFDERFKDLAEFIEWYNNERLSEAIDYQIPREVFEKDNIHED